MESSIISGQLVTVDVNTICDGIAVPRVGNITFELAKQYLDGVLTVSDNEVSKTVFLLLERAKVLAEPSGVVGLAALMNENHIFRGKKVCTIISGGNVDLSLITRIINRQLVQLGKFVMVVMATN